MSIHYQQPAVVVYINKHKNITSYAPFLFPFLILDLDLKWKSQTKQINNKESTNFLFCKNFFLYIAGDPFLPEMPFEKLIK